MKAYKDFIVSPIGERYNNSKKVGDKDLILNTEIFNHKFANRLALVLETPILFNTTIKKGDENNNGVAITFANLFTYWWLNISVFSISSLLSTFIELLYLSPIGDIIKSL